MLASRVLPASAALKGQRWFGRFRFGFLGVRPRDVRFVEVVNGHIQSDVLDEAFADVHLALHEHILLVVRQLCLQRFAETFSPIRVVSFDFSLEAAIIYPNPIWDELTVEMPKANIGKVTFEIRDVTGRD